MLKKILIALVVILVAIQFIPVDRTNPPITGDISAPQNVSNILKASCYDCHSNETIWPWYSYIAPVSFLVSSDVSDGRKRINFSEWDKYEEKKKSKKLEGIVEVVEEGEMPLSKYILMHPEAEMDQAKINLLKEWVQSNPVENKPLRYENDEEEKD